ncbi:hypothetical protein J4476_03105 [Candidatus Woesearchaeota archaeon]|nr:hypothetical protein [Candidatus Woesearchaeota archaeon]
MLSSKYVLDYKYWCCICRKAHLQKKVDAVEFRELNRRLRLEDRERINKDYRRVYRNENVDKFRENQKKYYSLNKNKVIESREKYRLKNLERMREYYTKNKEIFRQRQKEWCDKNRQKVRDRNNKWWSEHKHQIGLKRRKAYWKKNTLESYLQRKQAL